MKLPLATLSEAPTIEELARILRREDSPTGWSPLVAIQSLLSRPACFCIHGLAETLLSIESSPSVSERTSLSTGCRPSDWTRAALRICGLWRTRPKCTIWNYGL